MAKPAELVLLILLVGGLVMFAPFALPWGVVRWAMVAHVAMGVLLVPLVVLPFWRVHRRRLGRSTKRFHIVTGRVLELGLLLLFGSGAWLLFLGWNGTASGTALHWLHLGIGLPLILLVVVHAWRFSVLRLLLGLGALLSLGLVGAQLAHAAPANGQGGAVESRSLLLEPGGKTLLSANFDGGSVSRIDRATGHRLAEVRLGGDITSVAEDPEDGLIAATDYTGDRLHLLSASDLSKSVSVTLPGRPAGVVHDARNHLFWVAATEGNHLYGVTASGRIKVTIETAESPRGLALMPDGRLLVSHAMIGAVSIYDTSHLPLKLEKLIRLAVEQNPDQTVSQGLPRGLNRIAVSPDGKQAWLPHMLWNFDHPFQFQSPVFPAISVLSLKPGDEHEVVSRRKQLFRQINIVENGNRTRIVSNPADVAFSADGKKAYVTMSGSEDLVVFDLSRALPIDSRSRKARTTEGASAVQIYRHLPGEMPVGLVLVGQDIYVQNEMGLDLTLANTGGDSPFAQVKVVTPHFAKTVGQDPLAPSLRAGERLFNLANTSAIPDAPMAGDNWMSCSSCHVDGFNFTNRALFQATPVDKFHSAFTGHGSITSLVAGDFIGDYIRMVKNTQGGMGADTRFGTPVTDPAHPSAKVAAMMRDLHEYVTSPGNLPLLATWLRGKDGTGKVDPAAWTNSAICATCHSQITKQWSGSMHHFMAGSDPYYVVLEDLAAKDVGEPFRAWCMGCHAPEALLAGQTKTIPVKDLFTDKGTFRDTGLDDLKAELKLHSHAIDEGTSCLFCHTVTKVEKAGKTAAGNTSLNVDPGARPTYPFETSDTASLRAIADKLIRARPEVHAASLMKTIQGAGANGLCSACHEEFSPGNGAYITDTYSEWLASPYNAPNDPARNRTCLDCHMHARVDAIGKDVPGQATDRGPELENVVTHQFLGAQYHLLGLRDPKAAQETIALLRTAAKLSAHMAGKGDLVVTTTNTGAGHDLPTGVSDFRQLWLQIRVRDAKGKLVLQSGMLDAQGNLDPEAREFHKVLADTDAHAVGLRFWRLAKFNADTRIPAGKSRDEAFSLPPGTAYPVKVDARLMFRTFPQWITDKVIARFPKMPPPEAVEMAHVTVQLGQN
ncbi:hypothetical protein FGG78_22030 [Thioclava sp. BHET1]|nr:hypothetical protein FGG78_22030 [Thioclava sp. BHET1]